MVAAANSAEAGTRRTGPPCPPSPRRPPAAPCPGAWPRRSSTSATQIAEDRRHHREDRVALALVADHHAEGARQRERDHQQQEDLEQVGQRVRVLERVGGVGVVEAAAVGAELLDRLLAGDRAAGDGLRRRRRASVTSWVPARFCTTPRRRSGRPPRRPRAAAGSGRTPRARSTQKLPSRSVRDRAKPRISATATAMPTAADGEVLHREAGHLDQVAHRRPRRSTTASWCWSRTTTAVFQARCELASTRAQRERQKRCTRCRPNRNSSATLDREAQHRQRRTSPRSGRRRGRLRHTR